MTDLRETLMKFKYLLGFVFVAFALAAPPQERKGIVAEGGDPPDERASARLLYWDQDAHSAAGQIAVNYGQPIWKKDYEDPAKFDSLTKGKVWRMGKDFWTTLDTQLPLKIASKPVAVGSYFLGLHRSSDGAKWSLALIEPGEVRRAHLDASQIGKATVAFMAPMSAEKTEKTIEKLTITLTHPPDDLKNVTLKLAWGNMLLTTPIQVALRP